MIHQKYLSQTTLTDKRKSLISLERNEYVKIHVIRGIGMGVFMGLLKFCTRIEARSKAGFYCTASGTMFAICTDTK